MCHGEVAKTVQERVRKEGLPRLSRRNFLRFGGLTAAGLAVAPSLTLARPIRQEALLGEVIDLSHVFSPNVPTYVPTDTATRETTVTVENDGFYIQRWSFGEHTGTHADIPAHFIAGAETIDVYEPSVFLSPAVVIDIAAKAEENPDATLDVADIEAWESANGEIPAGAVVMLYSGWDTRWNDVAMFRNADADGVMHFPGFSPEAATFLMEQRDIHGIGVDTLSLDPGISSTFDVHLTVLGAGKYGLEGVANLAAIKDRPGTMVFVGIPRWEQGSGGPCRILAVAPQM